MRDVTVLEHATVTLYDAGCYSTFHDGTTYGALPHDTPHYDEIALRCGYSRGRGTEGPHGIRRSPAEMAAARLAYCREHEVFHHVVGATFYAGVSPVLWALAHGHAVDERAAALEEAMVMTLQRWVRAGERPIIGGVDWDGLRVRCLLLLGE